jgi:hypothetical protein
MARIENTLLVPLFTLNTFSPSLYSREFNFENLNPCLAQKHDYSTSADNYAITSKKKQDPREEALFLLLLR